MAHPLPKAEFQLVRPLDRHGGGDGGRRRRRDRSWLARRLSDGEEFVAVPCGDSGAAGTPFPADRQAERMVLALLNHENLVSVAGIISDKRIIGREADGRPASHRDHDDHDVANRRDRSRPVYVVWDRCDGGALAENMAQMARPDRDAAAPVVYMPESLCWHVLKSVMRAIGYLHDGVRYFITTAGADPHGPFPLELCSADRDWVPILHREIGTRTVFFQQPRGGETYGLCKLGSLSGAAATAHFLGGGAHSEPDEQAEGGFAVAASTHSQDHTSLSALMAEAGNDQNVMRPKEQRVYTLGDELRDLGALVFCMMTGISESPYRCATCESFHIRLCDDGSACVKSASANPRCGHEPEYFAKAERDRHRRRRRRERPTDGCRPAGPAVVVYELALARAAYSTFLRDAVLDLLWEDPIMGTVPASTAVPSLLRVEEAYRAWRQGTAEGRAYVDRDDEMERRWRVEAVEAAEQAISSS